MASLSWGERTEITNSLEMSVVISHMCIPFLIAFLYTLVVYIILSRMFAGNSAYGKKYSPATRVVPTTY